MNKLSDFYNSKIIYHLYKTSKYPILVAIQNGIATTLPLVMLGAIAILVRDFPILNFQNYMNAVFGYQWYLFCQDIVSGSIGIASFAVICTVSISLVASHNRRDKSNQISPVVVSVVVLSCFFIVAAPSDSMSWLSVLSMNSGLLLSLIVAITGTALFIRLSELRFLQLPLKALGSDIIIRDALVTTPTALVTISVFALVHILLLALGVTDLLQLFRDFVTRPFANMEASHGLAFLYVAASQVLWFFGIHGPDVLYSVEQNVLLPSTMADVLHGGANHFIFTKQFFDVFSKIGGSGSTLCLIAAILWRCHDKGARKLCLLALVPALCNVNEPILFGLPLVLNPIYFIPFMLAPLLQTAIAYLATIAHLVPLTVANVAWTTPVFISGYADTGSISGVILQTVNLSVGILIYFPFVCINDRLQEIHGKNTLHTLLEISEGTEIGANGMKCLGRGGSEGILARTLATDLKECLAAGKQLYLEYQPQVDLANNRVHGIEALLRWNHPVYGRIAPPIIVALAEDLGKIDDLGLFVLREACRYRVDGQADFPDDLVVAVNVSPRQLLNPHFADDVMEAVKASWVRPTQLEIEITEQAADTPSDQTIEELRHLRQLGIRVAIDDFGMGHTSLRYLQEFPVDTIKIDRSLTEESSNNVNDHIVQSIFTLSNKLGITTLVEGVEEPEQLSRFVKMGCHIFQGYLFSRPLAAETCRSFVNGWGKAKPKKAVAS